MNPIISDLDKAYGDGKKAQALMIVQTMIILIVPLLAIYSATDIDTMIILFALLGIWLVNWISNILRDMKESVMMERLGAEGLKVVMVEGDKK
jgi:hypothetical protein